MPLSPKVTGPVSPKDILHDNWWGKMQRQYGRSRQASLFRHYRKQGHSPSVAMRLTQRALRK